MISCISAMSMWMTCYKFASIWWNLRDEFLLLSAQPKRNFLTAARRQKVRNYATFHIFDHQHIMQLSHYLADVSFMAKRNSVVKRSLPSYWRKRNRHNAMTYSLSALWFSWTKVQNFAFFVRCYDFQCESFMCFGYGPLISVFQCLFGA